MLHYCGLHYSNVIILPYHDQRLKCGEKDLVNVEMKPLFSNDMALRSVIGSRKLAKLVQEHPYLESVLSSKENAIQRLSATIRQYRRNVLKIHLL